MKQIISVLFIFITVAVHAQVDPEEERIRSDLKAAALSGHIESQKDLGLFECQTGHFAEAMYWLKKAAERGNADAQFNLAIMYRDGEGCSVDYSQAMLWFKKAAYNTKYRREAWGEIGKMYEFGFGVPKDLNEAISIYKKGASLGDRWSMQYLGRICYESNDKEQALMWFIKSADAGNVGCAFNVYWMLEEQDLQTALRYLRQSVEGGDTRAMAFYGIRQLFGEGVPKNEKEGYDLIMKAAAQGDEVAIRFLIEYEGHKQ